MNESRSVTGLSPKVERPEIVTEEHLVFLDDLRESGVTNMHGAGSYLQDEFGFDDSKDAAIVLNYWMDTFAYRKKTAGGKS
jgi:hypothetical protein